MTDRILVGYDGGGRGADALAFARRWVRASGDQAVVVALHPGRAANVLRMDAEWVAYEREEANRRLAEAREILGDDVPATFRRVEADSAAHGLHDLAEEHRRLVVLGSRRRGDLRRTYPGSTAQRLLQGSSAPVAVVPAGYASTDDAPLARVAVAFVDTPDGRVALDHAARIAGHLSADLSVLTVVPDTRIDAGVGEPTRFGAESRRAYADAVQEAVAAVPGGGDLKVTSRVLDGPVVDALVEIGDDTADLLVCGSRGYGPVRSVLLGGVSSRVVRHARIPVVVVPRGAD